MFHGLNSFLLIVTATFLTLLFLLRSVNGIQSEASNNQNDGTENETVLQDFKEKLINFISLNGGLENFERAAGSAYQRYGYYSEAAKYPNQLNNFAQNNYGNGQQNYGYDSFNEQNFQEYSGYNQEGYGQQNYNLAQQKYYGPSYFGPDSQYGDQYFQGIARPVNYIRPQSREPSFLEALTSITRHDDLRCVPRLLCEVTSAGKVGSSESQNSIISFINKDSLVSLLTALNFVDDSPLMTFGRAALLGYSTRGSTRGCLQAYPTCPRDPDKLIEYLNNHNGGFFRFFRGTPGQNSAHYSKPYYRPRPSYRPSVYKKIIDSQNYSPQFNQYRILTKPAIYSSVSSVQFHEPNVDNYKLSVSPSRKGKKLSFPDNALKFTIARPETNKKLYQGDRFPLKNDFSTSWEHFSREPVNQFFPDRTGTGDFILDYDKFHTIKKTYYMYEERDPRKISFPESNIDYTTNKRMIFPQHRAKSNGIF